MWRTRAVQSALLEAVALRERQGERAEAALREARRRALLVVAVDLAAIVLLVLSGEDSLTLGASPRAVLTLGLLAVAVHAGFRLSQALTWGAALRVCQRLQDGPVTPVDEDPEGRGAGGEVDPEAGAG